MPPLTYLIGFNGKLLERGFWLYVFEIKTPDQRKIYYVGRTGDYSSSNAQSPFNRMCHHLGFNDRNNALRRRLLSSGIEPEDCTFRLIAHGPILREASSLKTHYEPRNITAALEAALADALKDAGYEIINKVNCHMPLDAKLFKKVRAAFAVEFPKLSQREKL